MFDVLLIIALGSIVCNMYFTLKHYLVKQTWDEMRLAMASFWCSVTIIGGAYTMITGVRLY